MGLGDLPLPPFPLPGDIRLGQCRKYGSRYTGCRKKCEDRMLTSPPSKVIKIHPKRHVFQDVADIHRRNPTIFCRFELLVSSGFTSISVSKNSGNYFFGTPFREAAKNYLADFSAKGGAPFPLRVFGQDDFTLRGEGVTPPFR